jgi:hypothetical protein
MSLADAARRLPATSPISMEATRTVRLSTLLLSVVAAALAIKAAVRSLVVATDRIGLTLSRVAAPCRPKALIGEPKLSDNPATQ